MKLDNQKIQDFNNQSIKKREHFRDLIRQSDINEQQYTKNEKLIQNEAFWDGVNFITNELLNK